MELEAPDEKKGMVPALDHGLELRGDADSSEEPVNCQGPLVANARTANLLDRLGRFPSATRSEPPGAAGAHGLALTHYRPTRREFVRNVLIRLSLLEPNTRPPIKTTDEFPPSTRNRLNRL